MKRPQKYKNKKIISLYSYCDPQGDELFLIGKTSDKEFPVWHLDERGNYVFGRGKVNVPYKLPELLATPPETTVFIVEGEKDVDTLFAAGLPATTNAGGSANSSAFKNWLDYFRGRWVCIIPDNDKPGRNHAEKVKAILAPVAAHVWTLELPELPPKGDVSDWFKINGFGRDELIVLAEGTRPARPDATSKSHGDDDPRYAMGDAYEGPSALPEEEVEIETSEWRPFPLKVLGEEIGEYVEEAGRMLSCDPSFSVLPALVQMGGAVGNSRVCRLNDTWYEPSVFWGCLVADPSSMKSPASDVATEPAVFLSDRFAVQNVAAQADYEQQFETWRYNGRFQKAGDAGENQHPPPKKPSTRRFRVEDITVEKLAEMLSDNPKGLLLLRDELGGWFSSFTRYKSGGAGGSDLDFWLEVFRARSKTVDRKSGLRQSLYVPRCACSVYGTFQPSAVASVFTPEFFQRGFVARILFAMPPQSKRVFVEGGIKPYVKERYHDTFTRLYYLDGETPIMPGGTANFCEFSPEGKEAWKAFYAKWSDRQWGTFGEIGYALAKLEAYCARFAMLYALCDFVNAHTPHESINARHVERAFETVDWFADEAARLYATIETPMHRLRLERLEAFIRKHGGEMTPRRLLMSNPKKYKTTEVTTRMLEELVTADLAYRDATPPGSQGGRPSSRYRLTT